MIVAIQTFFYRDKTQMKPYAKCAFAFFYDTAVIYK